ncbi:HDIG domain-containing metalloprotein [Acaryochloris sp. IP29b_bin.148]|uniref:HD family phosphohydrolase n=1 Tax=Acaryochloris sp. IP29b_bin.148 TaxID=2969218 RepID=UPI0026066A52|nr:HDIG domain-containing metalloprotein [Acaryochloris sp. IP29b_bin.148]
MKKLLRSQKLRLSRWLSLSSVLPPLTVPSVSKQRSFQQHSPLLFAVSVAALTSVIGHRFYNEPQLTVGTIAPETIRAPKSAQAPDPIATKTEREAVLRGAVSVYRLNSSQTANIQLDLNTYLADISKFRDSAGPLPYASTKALSPTAQHFLRQLTTGDFQKLLQQVSATTPPSTPWLKTANARQAISALKRYRANEKDGGKWSSLIRQIGLAQRDYQAALKSVPPRLQEFPSKDLLAFTEPEWAMAQRRLRTTLNRILTQGIPPGIPPSLMRRTTQVQLQDYSSKVRTLGQQLLPIVLKPNLSVDPAGTLRQREIIAEQIPIKRIPIRKDEIIVKEGETISQREFALLDHFGLSRRGINWLGLFGTLAAVSGGVSLFLVVQKRGQLAFGRRDYLLVLLLSVSSSLLIWTTALRYTSLPAVGLLVGSFYGPVLGATVVLILSGLIPLGLSGGLMEFGAIAVGSLVASLVARQRRSREEIALLGVIVAITQGVTLFVLMTLSGAPVYSILGLSLVQGLVGLGWTIVALGISPYIEHVFDLVTPIRLAELANPNRPLLKRLSREAPGTFQHTMFVATLAEAGASALGCNVELVRTGTLYHDIGKMHDPQFFIENQRDTTNKHDLLNDPWQSAEIIKKHVSEGLVMARKCRLPAAVQAFIPEHQGTMVIAFFHHQAQQQAAANPDLDPVQESDFRYPGPTPQSRETGIVMLADSCEAALRSLKDATPDLALKTINKIFKARWQDDQLVDSQLTRDELNVLAEVFVEVWMQFHHKRIPYPTATIPPK